MKGDWRKEAGKKGAQARIKLHGNPGTPEGRSLGGKRSIATHLRTKTKFKTLVAIRTPRKSVSLAELLGILMGDGHLGVYQVSVSTNSETDLEHAEYIQNLLHITFGLPVSLKRVRARKAVVITLSSKAACSYIATLGMPQGNKLTPGLHPPSWVLSSRKFRRAFLRGLIDTDGCVYQDRHEVKGKHYSSTCIAFTSASKELLEFVYTTLLELGLAASKSGRDVRVRRKKDVLKYAKEIGFSNPKHARKIEV